MKNKTTPMRRLMALAAATTALAPQTNGGLDFDHTRMFAHSSPIYDPKRPHKSYSAQNRAAKKRRKARN